MKLIKALIILNWLFWPTALFLSNTTTDFVRFFIPAALVFLSFVVFKKRPNLCLIPLLFIPFFDVKLAFIPLFATVINLFFSKSRLKINFIFVLIALFITIVQFKNYYGQTIIPADYQKQQEVIRNTHLYPNILTARIFNNKVRIVSDKFTNNFFALIDPNNYYFGYHPQEIVGNQNLKKFPAFSILFFLYALYKIKNYKYKKYLAIVATSSILGMSLLGTYDRSDFMLWPVIGLLVTFGIRKVNANMRFSAIPKNIAFGSILLFSLLEYAQLIMRGI